MIYKTILVFVLCLIVLSSFAFAETLDGQTPAEETICDVLHDATPGLYGLCVAYCSAHDADIALISGEILNTENANTKILENYRKKMQPGDPDMPCVASPCPCYSAADLAAIGSYKESCDSGTYNMNLRGIDEKGCKDFAALNDSICAYYNSSPDLGYCDAEKSIKEKLTKEEYFLCREMLEAEIADRGLKCHITK